MKKKHVLVGLGVALAALVVLAVRDYRAYAARTNASAVWAWVVTRYVEWTNPNTAVFADPATARRLVRPGDRTFLDATALGRRSGPRPDMVRGIPHRALDQHPDPALRAYMKDRLAAMRDFDAAARARLVFRPSLWELTGAEAFIVKDCSGSNCGAVLVRAKGEFAHLHSHDGSLHLMLSPRDIVTVVESGYGELFPVSGALSGKVPYIVLVYAPRTTAEADAAAKILAASYAYATTPDGE